MIDVLIIESNVELAIKLQQTIEKTGEFAVSKLLHSVADARDWLNIGPSPQLIFCDIVLPDGLGFDIFRNTNLSVPVIFCTSDHAYAIRAFENNGIDYLLKPFDHARVQKSLKKFLQLKELFGEETMPEKKKGKKNVSYKSSLLVYFQDKIIPINLEKLDFIYYNNYQVNVHTQNAQYETRDTLNNIIAALNPRDFYRANRQFIIHRKMVTSIQQYFGRKLLVGTSSPTPEPIIISKANASEFLRWVEGANLGTGVLDM
ncbi:LytR/AlgR family response regulator transcription factor [Dyadobacter sandarakinus]|uniref:Response regulator transcription factor n=1 Tax=Dyadobacter sandarakinus TaxID=2747268 RepID=A0ABX7I0U6_9BACT|nr:LytTR family DNA-binding domain-containing protein [Dyadobacter sandarakinus]QRQ99452.1 response regulator transcription factor [Dyadobacter sandarakinus]